MKMASASARQRRLRRRVVVPLRCSKLLGGGGFRFLGKLQHSLSSSESLQGLFVRWRNNGGGYDLDDVGLKVGRHNGRGLLALPQREHWLQAVGMKMQIYGTVHA